MPFVPPWEDINPRDFLQAAEEGAHIGLAARGESAREGEASAQESLEASRLNQAAQEAAANRSAEQSDAALRAKYEAQALGARVGQQEERNALDYDRLEKPEIRSPRGGGVVSIDPLTGQLTTLQAAPPAAPPVSPFDKAQLAQLNARSIAIEKAIQTTGMMLANPPAGTSIDAIRSQQRTLAAERQRVNDSLTALAQKYGASMGAASPLNSPPPAATDANGLPAAPVPTAPAPTPSGSVGGVPINLNPKTFSFYQNPLTAGSTTSPVQPQSAQGYKIGATYKGGLTYLGGDPNDEKSWKQTDVTATSQ